MDKGQGIIGFDRVKKDTETGERTKMHRRSCETVGKVVSEDDSSPKRPHNPSIKQKKQKDSRRLFLCPPSLSRFLHLLKEGFYELIRRRGFESQD